MTIRSLIPLILSASAAAGVGAGVLVSQVTDTGDGRKGVRSMTGVSSGVDGTQTKQPEKRGVNQVTVSPEAPAATNPVRKTDADQSNSRRQTVDIKGVKGAEGITMEPQNTIEMLTTNEGSMQSVRGIKGIDTVMLQNLEAVLRMQAPPPPPPEGGGGGVRAAAALLTMENDEPPDPEEQTDDREELTEFQLEGS